MVPTIVVHGGSGTIAAENHADALAAVQAAARAGQDRLRAGQGCEAAVVAAVRVLEDAEVTNSARGACMTADGEFELDAGIMRSADMAHGAVAAVRDLANPIELAQALMNDGRHRLLVGEGAAAFARAAKVGRFDRDAVWTAKAARRYEDAKAGRGSVVGQADTVGAVAIDEHGHLCAGGSTGGVLLKAPGRVGDCPMIGPGFYASPTLGAACATGVGEAIMTAVASLVALQQAAAGSPPDAAADSICAEVARTRIEGVAATCGIILITPAGQVGVGHRSPHMSWAIARGDAAVESGLER